MTADSTTPELTDSPLAPPNGAPYSGHSRNIFVGPEGIRPGWRFAMFVAIDAALQLLVFVGVARLIPSLGAIVKQARHEGVLTPQIELTLESLQLVLAFGAAAIMSRIEKRSFGEYGISLSGAFGKLFWQGVVWGLALQSAEMLLMSALGGFTFGGLALAGASLAKFAVLWAIGFVFVGLFEEFLFRGYAQFTLASGIGFWPAAVLLSGVFGAVHLTNHNEGWVGALSVFVFGMFGCFALRRTGNLWFMVGLHAAADYAETFIYSVPDSGLTATGHLLNSTLHGPRWLTGGAIGPEGSLIDFLLFAVAFLVFSRMYPAKKIDAYPYR